MLGAALLSGLVGTPLGRTPVVYAGEPAARSRPPEIVKPDAYWKRVVAPHKGKALIVNFWATWCGPCREEMPGLVRAAARFGPEKAAVALVSLDSLKTGPREIPAFLAKLKVPFPSFLASFDDPERLINVVDRSWDGTLPYSVLYDCQGKFAGRLVGSHSQAGFEAAFTKLLGQ